MAEVKNCLGIRGRVGDFVLYRLGGKTFLRKRAKRNDSNTEEQRAVRARFRTAVRFYQKLKETPLDEVLEGLSKKGGLLGMVRTGGSRIIHNCSLLPGNDRRCLTWKDGWIRKDG